MIKKLFLASGISIITMIGMSQVVFAQGVISETKTATTTDELCTMSNGNRIPCVFLQDAEKDVVSGGKVIDRISGTEFCQTDDGYVPCSSVTAEGKPTLAYQLQQYSNIVMVFLYKYGAYFAALVAILLGLAFAQKKLAK